MINKMDIVHYWQRSLDYTSKNVILCKLQSMTFTTDLIKTQMCFESNNFDPEHAFYYHDQLYPSHQHPDTYLKNSLPYLCVYLGELFLFLSIKFLHRPML